MLVCVATFLPPFLRRQGTAANHTFFAIQYQPHLTPLGHCHPPGRMALPMFRLKRKAGGYGPVGEVTSSASSLQSPPAHRCIP